jgi:FAD dependent oxidoreductase
MHQEQALLIYNRIESRSGEVEHSVGRRQVLASAGAAALLGALESCGGRILNPAPATRLQLPPLHTGTDRITRVTVCTRPFRAEGPRLDTERIGEKTIVHNYGHGGSGWSLCWGSSSIAAQKALATGERDIAVVGCGALGLTSGLLLQRAGARATIYAKDLPPNVRSSLATGVWSPDSRICLAQHATPAFKQLWEGMARQSFQTYQNFLGLPGDPVEFFDIYVVSDEDFATRRSPPDDPRPAFAELQRELVPDLIPRHEDFAPGTHPFGARHVRRNSLMMFNLSAYARLLMSDFLAGGGRIQIAEFRTPADFAPLPQKTLINATGYGARALFGDESVTPVRGQLAHAIPQTDIHYGLAYQSSWLIPRRDGLVFQYTGESDYYGFGDDTTVPDRAEAERAVNTIGGLFA